MPEVVDICLDSGGQRVCCPPRNFVSLEGMDGEQI